MTIHNTALIVYGTVLINCNLTGGGIRRGQEGEESWQYRHLGGQDRWVYFHLVTSVVDPDLVRMPVLIHFSRLDLHSILD
jgi:hypothetical protein